MSISTRVSELALAIRDKINEMIPRLLPRGGQAGQVLVKSSSTDFTVIWGEAAPQTATRGGWAPVRAVATGAIQEIDLPESDLTLDDIIVFVEGVFQHSGYSIANAKLVTTQPIGFEVVIVAYGARAKSSFEWSTQSQLLVWAITHNLGRYPQVIITDDNGTQITGQITYIDRNAIEIEFTLPTSGRAILE